MSEAEPTGHKIRTASPRESESRARPENSIFSGEVAEFLQGDVSNSPFSKSTFDRHVELLSDSHLANKMATRRRAAIVQQLQGDYGNHYVQRLVNQVSQNTPSATQTDSRAGL